MADNEHLNGALAKLTEAILASYAAEARTRRIGETFLPSREKICEILAETQVLVFPGYFGHKLLTEENVGYHVGNLLVRLGRAAEASTFLARAAASYRDMRQQ